MPEGFISILTIYLRMRIAIVGGGIGGLTLALALHQRGVTCDVYEAAPEIKALGVGINLLPHATRQLADLGLEDALARAGIATKESVFFNRFGQLIYREPAGRFAGYDWPQFSIHRGDLHLALARAVRERLGEERLHVGLRCTGVEQDDDGATLRFVDASGAALEPVRAEAVVACDGIHSALRKQFHPQEGDPRYTGVMMWRGTTVWPPFLSGASMVRAGWLSTGKMVIYPIRPDADGAGNQLVNWVAEIEAPQRERERDWSRAGALEDFLWAFADWHFDWLDVPELIRRSQMVLEFPMVDQEPLERWTFGRVTLLGDAAHPMVPRGSNGAGQAIVDARVLARLLTECDDPRAAFAEYEALRRPATANVVRTNRQNPPDAIIREVVERTGDAPFANIDDVISHEELVAMSESYKRVAGYDKDSLAASSTS